MSTRMIQTPAPIVMLLGAKHYCAVDADSVMHAVGAGDALGHWDQETERWEWAGREVEVVCGSTAQIMWVQGEGAKVFCVGFPPRTASLPKVGDGYSRCSDCWNLTGRKRPHADWPAS